MCADCMEGARHDRCPACRAPAPAEATGGYRFQRAGFLWGDLLRFTFELYQRNFATLTLSVVAVFAAPLLFQGLSLMLTLLLDGVLATLVTAALFVAESVAQAILSLGLIHIAVSVGRGEKPRPEMLVGVTKRVWAFLLQSALIYLVFATAAAIAAGPVLLAIFVMELPVETCVVVGVLSTLCGAALAVYLGLGLVFAPFELVAHPDVSAWQGMRNAWTLARGQRLTLVLGFIIGGVCCAIGSLLCGVGVVFGASYALLLTATLYLTLRSGAPDPVHRR